MAYDIGSVLGDWESLGVFDFVLPFLLIFAVVYGILTASKIFSGNKGVNLVISVTIGLMALRFGFVQAFYGEVFPRFGVAIAVFIVVIILGSVFVPERRSKLFLMLFAWFGIILGGITVFKSLGYLGWLGASGWWYNYGSTMILGILLLVLIIAIFIGPLEKDKMAHESHQPISFARS